MSVTKQFSAKTQRILKWIIYEKTGCYIKGNCLLNQAFTRRSYTSQNGGENNEILEFIGDQILSYYVVKIIAENYGALNSDYEYTFRVRENRFTELKQHFINNVKLAEIIDEWGLAEYLIVGKGDYSNEVDKQVKVKADLFEAILGAVAITSKWNGSVLEKAVRQMLSIEEELKSIIETDYRPVQFDMENSINTLKELAEHGECSIPEYEYGTPEELGYDQDGNPIWVCTCTIINDRTGIIRQVWSSSKKAAKRAAAYLVLCDHFGLQNEYGINGKYLSWTYKNGRLMPDISMKK